MVRHYSLKDQFVSLLKFLLAVSVGVTLRSLYDLPVIPFHHLPDDSGEGVQEKNVGSLEQEILGSDARTQLHEPFRPHSESEVIQYEYFNMSVTARSFNENDPISTLRRIDRLDIADLLSQATTLLSSARHSRCKITRLSNGYRRLDPVRGIEYMLDVLTSSCGGPNKTVQQHRLQLTRPFSAIQLLSDDLNPPKSIVHFVIAIHKPSEEFYNFLSNFEAVCQESSDAGRTSYLIIVLCSNTSSYSNSVRSAVSDVQRRHRYALHIRVVHTRRPFSAGFGLDLGTRELPGTALIMFADVGVRFTASAIERCRLCAVDGQQVYYPIPFARYRSDIVQRFTPEEIDVNNVSQHTGEWATYDYSLSCMHARDYRLVAGFILTAVDPFMDLYERHVTSNLHVFRSVDPGLTRPFISELCDNMRANKSRTVTKHCENLASQQQLAKLTAEKQL